jgi:hypothetical protein
MTSPALAGTGSLTHSVSLQFRLCTPVKAHRLFPPILRKNDIPKIMRPLFVVELLNYTEQISKVNEKVKQSQLKP